MVLLFFFLLLLFLRHSTFCSPREKAITYSRLGGRSTINMERIDSQHFTVHVNCQLLIVDPVCVGGAVLRSMQPHYLHAKHMVATSLVKYLICNVTRSQNHLTLAAHIKEPGQLHLQFHSLSVPHTLALLLFFYQSH